MTVSDIRNRRVSPILKWAGGKRWLISKYLSVFSKFYNQYIEPFLGRAEVFFQLCPQDAILSDINKDLIDTYAAKKSNLQRVFDNQKKHHNKPATKQTAKLKQRRRGK